MTFRILFRFHKNPDVCCQNLQLLRALNPDLAIDGLYGGNEKLSDLPPRLTKLFDSLWAVPLDDPYYKWKNGDLCVRWWFKDNGHQYKFTHVYLIERDMFFLKPLSQIYGTLKSGCSYVPIFGDYIRAKEIDWYWSKQQYGVEVDDLLHQLKTEERPVDFEKLSFGTMGGCALSRLFLEKYAQESFVSSYSNDELCLSIYSSVYGIPLVDTGFWKNPNNCFNADNEEYSGSDFDQVLMQGGDVIHPLRVVIPDLEEKVLG